MGLGGLLLWSEHFWEHSVAPDPYLRLTSDPGEGGAAVFRNSGRAAPVGFPGRQSSPEVATGAGRPRSSGPGHQALQVGTHRPLAGSWAQHPLPTPAFPTGQQPSLLGPRFPGHCPPRPPTFPPLNVHGLRPPLPNFRDGFREPRAGVPTGPFSFSPGGSAGGMTAG